MAQRHPALARREGWAAVRQVKNAALPCPQNKPQRDSPLRRESLNHTTQTPAHMHICMPVCLQYKGWHQELLGLRRPKRSSTRHTAQVKDGSMRRKGRQHWHVYCAPTTLHPAAGRLSSASHVSQGHSALAGCPQLPDCGSCHKGTVNIIIKAQALVERDPHRPLMGPSKAQAHIERHPRGPLTGSGARSASCRSRSAGGRPGCWARTKAPRCSWTARSSTTSGARRCPPGCSRPSRSPAAAPPPS